VPSEYQLRVALNSDEAVGISAKRITTHVALLFAANKTPYLVALHIGHVEIADAVFQEPFALVARQDEQGKYRGVMYSGKALDCADRTPFREKLYNLSRSIQGRVHAAQRRCMIFCEGLTALLTAEALKTVAVFSKLLTAGIAVVARHYEPCLSLAIGSQWSCVDSCEQSLGFQPPFSVGAEGGGFFFSSFLSYISEKCIERSLGFCAIGWLAISFNHIKFFFDSAKHRMDGNQKILRGSTLKPSAHHGISDLYRVKVYRSESQDGTNLLSETLWNIANRGLQFISIILGKGLQGLNQTDKRSPTLFHSCEFGLSFV
jgi:hypothetical protein